jgi:hypothetical protein
VAPCPPAAKVLLLLLLLLLLLGRRWWVTSAAAVAVATTTSSLLSVLDGGDGCAAALEFPRDEVPGVDRRRPRRPVRGCVAVHASSLSCLLQAAVMRSQPLGSCCRSY